ncbi:MAG: hypothetical protein Q9183_002824 [Haloplaca sp. 2 TL-2023]
MDRTVLSIKQLERHFQDIVSTAGSLQISDSQAAAACDALRASLTQCEESEISHFRTLAFSQSIWSDVFEVFLTTSHNRKPKPLKLLLVALQKNLTKNPSQRLSKELVIYVCSRTWENICTHEDQTAFTKPALQALRHFMSKSIIHAQDIVSAISRSEKGGDGEDHLRRTANHFPSLDSIPNSQYTAPIAGRVISLFCRSLRLWSCTWAEAAVAPDSQPLWWSILKSSLKKEPSLINLFASHVLPEISHQDREGVIDLANKLQLLHQGLDHSSRLEPEDLRINLIILGIRDGTLSETQGLDDHSVETIGAQLLCHANPEVRSVAFALTISSSSVKQPFASTTLKALESALPYYHAEASPKIRQEVLATIRRLFQRLFGSLNRMSTKIMQQQVNGEHHASKIAGESTLKLELYHQHLAFYNWYSRFLSGELSPGAPYQRHLLALKVIESLTVGELHQRFGAKDSTSNLAMEEAPHVFFSDELLMSLIDLILDPFDDVRELAASILHNVPEAVWSELSSRRVSERSLQLAEGPKDCQATTNTACSADELLLLPLVLRRATCKMQQSGRADHADGFGRLYSLFNGAHTTVPDSMAWAEDDSIYLGRLFSRLEECIEVARTNIYVAVKTASLHGYLIAAR